MENTSAKFVSMPVVNHSLRPFISHYYFHESTSEETLHFTYYPHVNHAVTAYIGSSAKSNDETTYVDPHPNQFTPLYSRLQLQAHQVWIKGPFRKVGIVFQPYGVNYFIQDSLKSVSPYIISNFSIWGTSFEYLCSAIWSTGILEERVALLETFLLERKQPSPHPLFAEMLACVFRKTEMQNVSQLATLFQLNRKTIYRLFKQELGCSPSQYFRIIKFRKSLDLYLESNQSSLTQAAIAYHYDQSDFIKNVKAKTQQTPKQFFRDLSQLGGGTYWTFPE